MLSFRAEAKRIVVPHLVGQETSWVHWETLGRCLEGKRKKAKWVGEQMCAEDLGFKTELDGRRMRVKCPFP